MHNTLNIDFGLVTACCGVRSACHSWSVSTVLRLVQMHGKTYHFRVGSASQQEVHLNMFHSSSITERDLQRPCQDLARLLCRLTLSMQYYLTAKI